MSRRAGSDAWTWRHAIARSDLPGTTKHVLYSLSIFMNEAGQGCFPPIENGKEAAAMPQPPLDLKTATGLSKRAIIKHLAEACEAGWLKRARHGYAGQKWKRFEYEARWPEESQESTEPERAMEGGDLGAPPLQTDAVTDVREGGDPASPRAVTDVHRDKEQSIDQSSTSPLSRESARARGENNDALGRTMRNAATLDALIAAWKRGAIGGAGALGDLDKALTAVDALEPDEHEQAVERAPRFLRAIKDAKRNFTMSIERYVHGHQFIHHPPPAKANPDDLAPVELKPFTSPLWFIMWKALNKARSSPENLQHRRRLLDAIDWIERGATMPAATVPPEAESSALVPIKVDSPEFIAWRDYAARVGLPKLPKPDHVPVIFVPALLPPTLTGSYPLAVPVRIEVVGQVWWWRYWQRIADGNPVVVDTGRHTIDALGRARRSHGSQEISAGPLPLPSDLAELVQIEPTTRPFEAWTDWLTARGTNALWMWDRGPIWVPSEYPQAGFGTAPLDPTPDYDALEEIGPRANGEAA